MDGILPDYIKERVKVCIDAFRIIMQSKPDKHKTAIVVVANEKSAENIKEQPVVGVPSFHAVIKPFVRVTDEIMSLVQ